MKTRNKLLNFININLLLIVVFSLTMSFMLEENFVTNNSVNVNKYFDSHNVISNYEEELEEDIDIEKEIINIKVVAPIKEEIIKDDSTINIETHKEEVIDKNIETVKGNISFYTAECIGCSGYTASGYNIKDTIYYNDKEFGKVRVLAGDRSLFGSIIEFKLNNETIRGIVLDTGGSVGTGKRVLFDLLVETREEAIKLGIKRDINFSIIRKGY